MNVWVPGGRGMLGRAVCARLRAAGIEPTVSGRELDLADGPALRRFVRAHGPAWAINCAAYTQVDACETDAAAAAAAAAANHVGAANLGRACAEAGCAAVHVSTDYVFDGRAQRPYTEADRCAPLGVYGRSKWLGEQAFLAAAGDRGWVVRTAWLYGHGGRHFVGTMLRLMGERDALRVVADQVGGPTSCDDLAAALVALLGLPRGPAAAPPGLYHFANAGQTSWHGLACAVHAGALARRVPLRCRRVEAIGTDAYPTAAPRPPYSVLDCSKLTAALGAAPRPWQQALDAYMDSATAASPRRPPGPPARPQEQR